MRAHYNDISEKWMRRGRGGEAKVDERGGRVDVKPDAWLFWKLFSYES